MTATKNDGQALQIDELLAVDESSITTLIDVGVCITGSIKVSGGRALLISGTVEGEVESDGPVLINTGGIVRGSIKSKSLQVAGTIDRINEDDLVQVYGPLILADTAVVNCNIVSEGMKTAYGAVMNGSFRPHGPRANVKVMTDAPEQALARATHEVSMDLA